MTAWIPERFRALCESTGMSQVDLARALNIPYSTFLSYINKSCPGLNNLIRIADYFDISLDFLLGRCSEEQTQSILTNYPAHFMKLRKTAYENYLVGRKPLPSDITKTGYESPWPYNMIEDLTKTPVTHILTERNLKALDVAINSLLPREKTIFLAYYRDGQSLRTIAAKYNISSTRIQQIIRKTICKLSHPRFTNAITENWYTAEELNKIVNQLDLREKVLETHEREYLTALDILKQEQDAIDIIIDELRKKNMPALSHKLFEIKNGIADPSEIIRCNTMLDESICLLNISRRSYNCLLRAGYTTIRNVYELLRHEPQKIKSIKNLGSKSICEIISAVNTYTGSNFKAC